MPEGVYFIGSNLTLHADIRFEGTVIMDDATYLSLTRNFDLPTYIDAFGSEQLGFRKAFQALLNYSDHEILDMCGRRIDVTEPIDMHDAYSSGDVFAIRRVIKNGQFYVIPGAAWDDEVATSAAQYNPSNPNVLSNVANVSAIRRGAVVSGSGVGREVYVKEVHVNSSQIVLSQPLWGPAPNQTYTFTRHQYILDFGGFEQINRMNLSEIEFQCRGSASGIMLAREGENFVVQDCFFVKPKDRGISSTGRACQDLHVDRCQFISNEQGIAATARKSVAFNVNANDSKIRDNRFQRMGTSMVIYGTGHMLQGNHLFQGDEVTDGPRVAGMVFTYENNKSVVNGNYIDNCFIEWNNEHDAKPDYGSEYSFGGMTIMGNIFTANDVAPWFSWIVVKPFGVGHYISGFHVTNNTFRTIAGAVDRIESVSTTHAGLDNYSIKDLTFSNNAFVGVAQKTLSPVTLQYNQNTQAATWTVDGSAYLPFGGNARAVSSVVVEGQLRDNSNALVWDNPHVNLNQGVDNNKVSLDWSTPVKGTVHVTMRVDKPV